MTAASRAPQIAANALRHAIGDVRPRESDPRDVGIHRTGLLELAPEIEQHQLVLANHAMLARRGEVMRIAGVLLRRDARRGIGDQPFVLEPADHLLLNVVLGGRDAVAQPARDFFERLILDAIELF